ncbi:MAG: flavodoxin family protein [Desulfobulbus sp.]|jgi:multimeric flavodoxin WrbA
MHNILIINGSPRKRSNTDLLLEQVELGIHHAGYRSEHINLVQLAIQPCTGCANCVPSGECIITDDMTALYDKVWAADRIVIGTPIYFCGVTALTKAFIDRCQALRYRKERPDIEARRGYMVAVAAAEHRSIFDGARQTLVCACDAMACTYSGEVLGTGIEHKAAVADRPEILLAALQLGTALCRTP